MTFATAARVVVGGLFAGHGLQKLTGVLDGDGLEATAETFDGLGLRPGRRHALAAGLAEAGGGALLAAGRAVPLAASALSATMITAVRVVHGRNGPWNTGGGYEYNLVLLAALAALTEERHGRAAAAAQLALAGLASSVAIESGRRYVDEPGLGEPDPVITVEDLPLAPADDGPRFTRAGVRAAA